MKKIDWANHLIEFITVVIGIGLAFALNNWNEKRKEINQAALFLNSIKEEIKINLEEVEKKYKYHQELLDNLNNKPTETELIIRSATLEDHAWEMANNNIFKQHTDFEIYKDLSKLYSIQNTLKQTNKEASEMMAYLNVNSPYLMIPLFDKEMDEKFWREFMEMRRQSWIPVFEDMSSVEKTLIELYREILEKIQV